MAEIAAFVECNLGCWVSLKYEKMEVRWPCSQHPGDASPNMSKPWFGKFDISAKMLGYRAFVCGG